MNCIVSSCGFGGTGSSAITDLLKEFDCICNNYGTYEWKFLYENNGLSKLDDAIKDGRWSAINGAANAFLEVSMQYSKVKEYKDLFDNKFLSITKKFMQNLFSIKWNGFSYLFYKDAMKKKSFMEKIRINCANGYYQLQRGNYYGLFEPDGWQPVYFPYIDIYFENDRQKFIQEARHYTKELFSIAMNKVFENKNNKDIQYLNLDQLFPSASISKYFNYFDIPVRHFIVDKDPRDLFLANNLFWGERYIPSLDVWSFIDYWKKTRQKSYEDKITPGVSFIMLDDLIFNYDETVKKVYDFLKIDSSCHTQRKTYFIPEKSAKNIQLYKKYTNYKDEIALIEKELKDFLSPYSSNNVFAVNNKLTIEKPISKVLQDCDLIQDGKYKMLSYTNNTGGGGLSLISLFYSKLSS